MGVNLEQTKHGVLAFACYIATEVKKPYKRTNVIQAHQAHSPEGDLVFDLCRVLITQHPSLLNVNRFYQDVLKIDHFEVELLKRTSKEAYSCIISSLNGTLDLEQSCFYKEDFSKHRNNTKNQSRLYNSYFFLEYCLLNQRNSEVGWLL